MRRIGILLSTLVAAVATATGAATAATDPRAERERLTPADMALAKRMTLTGSDLAAGWRRTATPKNEDATLSCPGFNPDFSRFTITGKADSTFRHPAGAQITSATEVFATPAQAVGDYRLGARPALAGCLRYLLNREFAKTGLMARIRSSRMVRAPSVGARAAAYRLVGEAHAGANTVSIHVDMLVLQRGRSIALLLFSNVRTPVPGQVALARVVARRMR